MAQFDPRRTLSRLLDHPNIVKVLEVGVVEGPLHRDGAGGRPGPRADRPPLQAARDSAAGGLRGLPGEGAAGGARLRARGGRPRPGSRWASSTATSRRRTCSSRGRGRSSWATSAWRARRRAARRSCWASRTICRPSSCAGSVAPAADLWAATVTLYELLTLERPVLGKTPEEVFAASARRRARRSAVRPDVSPSAGGRSPGASRADPEERFPSAGRTPGAPPHYDEHVGTPLAIAAVVRGLFGAPPMPGLEDSD